MTSPEECTVWTNALNNTDYRVLVWSLNEEKSRKAGLKNAKMITSMRKLTTTGK
jgi:hypothetical protein